MYKSFFRLELYNTMLSKRQDILWTCRTQQFKLLMHTITAEGIWGLCSLVHFILSKVLTLTDDP